MPGVYEKMGIRFLYPDNWTLDEEEALEGNRSVTVYSPERSVLVDRAAPDGTDPDELASTAVAALQAEYQDSESEPASDQIGGSKRSPATTSTSSISTS